MPSSPQPQPFNSVHHALSFLKRGGMLSKHADSGLCIMPYEGPDWGRHGGELAMEYLTDQGIDVTDEDENENGYDGMLIDLPYPF